MKNDLLKGLSREQVAKVRNCKSQEELLALAKQEGVELSDEQLAAVSGGACHLEPPALVCPQCGNNNPHRFDYTYDDYANNSRGAYKCTCLDCGYYFEFESK